MKSIQSIQEIASEVNDPAGVWETRRLGKTPPGKAQQIILDALSLEANNFAHANKIFNALGFAVEAKRVGRKSVPVVHLGILEGGVMNQEHEGEYWDLSPDVNLDAIAEWVVR